MVKQLFYFLSLVVLAACSEPAAQVPQNKIQHGQETVALESLNKEGVEIEREEILHYADSLGIYPDSSLYSLRYRIIKTSTSRLIKKDDEVKFLYSVRTLDGEWCENYTKRQAKIIVGKSEMPKGIEESLMLLGDGGVGEFLIQSNWAYGVLGNSCVPPRTPIVCKIVILKILEEI